MNSTDRIYKLTISQVYPLYIAKVERKGRTKADVDAVTRWLTGFDDAGIQEQIDAGATFPEFFAAAPKMNSQADRVRGVICGVRVEDLEDPVVQNMRRLDKLVDEVAKGKAMEKILNRPE